MPYANNWLRPHGSPSRGVAWGPILSTNSRPRAPYAPLERQCVSNITNWCGFLDPPTRLTPSFGILMHQQNIKETIQGTPNVKCLCDGELDPGGHPCNHHYKPIIPKSSHHNPFKDVEPVDFYHGYPIPKWDTSNGHQTTYSIDSLEHIQKSL